MSIELQNLSFFSGIREEKLEKLEACSELRSFAEGNVILRRGKIATGFYVIRSGHVGLEDVAPHNESIHLQTLSRGDLLGWSWIIPFRQWYFDATALGPVSALWFEGEEVEDLFGEDTELGRDLMHRFLEIMAGRVESLRHQIDDWYRPVQIA